MSKVEWIRPRRCETGACAEVTMVGDEVWLRSSRRDGNIIAFDLDEWREMLAGVKAGDFDEIVP